MNLVRKSRPSVDRLGWNLVDFWPRLGEKPPKVSAKSVHRRPRKCVSAATFEGKIWKPKLKGPSLTIVDQIEAIQPWCFTCGSICVHKLTNIHSSWAWCEGVSRCARRWWPRIRVPDIPTRSVLIKPNLILHLFYLSLINRLCSCKIDR